MGALVVVTYFCQHEELPDVLDIRVILRMLICTRFFAIFYFPKLKLCVYLSLLVIKSVN